MDYIAAETVYRREIVSFKIADKKGMMSVLC